VAGVHFRRGVKIASSYFDPGITHEFGQEQFIFFSLGSCAVVEMSGDYESAQIEGLDIILDMQAPNDCVWRGTRTCSLLSLCLIRLGAALSPHMLHIRPWLHLPTICAARLRATTTRGEGLLQKASTSTSRIGAKIANFGTYSRRQGRDARNYNGAGA